MELHLIVPALIPVVVIQIYFQIYAINHLLGNVNIQKNSKIIWIICIVLFNNLAVAPYLFFVDKHETNLSSDVSQYFRRGVVSFINLSYQVFLLQLSLSQTIDQNITLILIINVVLYVLVVLIEVFRTISKEYLVIFISVLLFIIALALEYLTLNTAVQVMTLIAFIGILNGIRNRDLSLAVILMTLFYFIFILFKASLIYDNLGSDEVTIYVFTTEIIAFLVILSFSSLRRQVTQNQTLKNLVVQLNHQAQTIEEMTAKEERMRIAVDIHDHVGHTLTTATIQLESVLTIIDDPQLIEKISLANQQVKSGLNQIRVLVRGVDIDFNNVFGKNVKLLVESSRRTTGLDIHLDVLEEVELVPLQQKVLLSALKEFITNSVKHGKSQQINVLITTNNDYLEMTLSNDGVVEGEVTYGFGLTQMEKAIHSIGGIMNVTASIELGFIVYYKIPIGGILNE